MVNRLSIGVVSVLALLCTASAKHGEHHEHHDHDHDHHGHEHHGHDGHNHTEHEHHEDKHHEHEHHGKEVMTEFVQQSTMRGEDEGFKMLTRFSDSDAQQAMLFSYGNRSHPDCSHYCNDEKLNSNALAAEGPHPKVCIGNFKVFCTGHRNRTCGMFGLKCEGQFTYYRLPNDTRFAACEGLFKQFVKVESVDKGDNSVARKMVKASGCLGTSSAFVHGWKHGNRTRNDSALALLGGSFQDAQLDAAVSHLDLSEVDNVTHAIVEGRCNGLSGRVSVFGKKRMDASANAADFATLEAAVDSSLADAAVELLPKSPFTGVDGQGMEFSKHVHVDCTMTCNGKPAWLHGKFPCWGKFEVECDVERAERESGEAKESTPFTLATGSDVAFTGSCQGFWSGVLGKKCMGFAKSHVETRRLDAWEFCAGHEGVFAKHRPGMAAMGQYCKGRHLVAVTAERRDED